MKITAFGDMESGCFLARIRRPLFALYQHGHAIKMQKEGDVDYSTDIVIFNNLFEAEMEKMLADFKKHNIKVVYDCDDAMDVHPDFLSNTKDIEKTIPSYDYMLKNADLVTTTTKTLAEHLKIRRGDKPIMVLPNCLFPDEFTERTRHKRLRIGLAGSLSHAKDLLMMIDEIAQLKMKYDFDFVLFGFTNKSFDEWILKSRGTEIEYVSLRLKVKLKKMNAICVGAVRSSEYPRKLSDIGLDIGICPLEESEFNRNKSCIKFYEYAMAGTCAVASNVLPFSEEPVTKMDQLEKLIVDSRFRTEETLNQHEWVMANRDMTKEYVRWEKAFKKLIK
jgi:glycosyltransferase involved in cell wall biosynthesis